MSTPRPNKSLGQHWLFDEASLAAMCQAANVQPTDTVLEIGPGLGPLTVMLTALAKQVIAVELDEQLARELPARVPAANLQVVQGDILQFNLSQLPPGYKVAANVPYYLTSHLVRQLASSPTPPSLAVLLVQKEVAERIAAQPGRMSMLAVMAQFYTEPQLGPVVLRTKFTPPPQVDSQVVVLHHHGKPLFTDIKPEHFFRIVKAGFGEKRKTLRNSLSGGLAISPGEAEQLLRAAGLDPSARAEQLSLAQWHTLAKKV